MGVDARTKLVGQNRLELLLFHLGGSQHFAINVFKVQEVMQMPRLTRIPDRHPVVRGVTHLRGQTVPVVDPRHAIQMGPLKLDEDDATIIVTEYNMTVQAFLVGGVDRIVNMNWNEILPPPGGSGRQHYLTAITRIDDRIVEIIDVEKVLAEIAPYHSNLSDDAYDNELRNTGITLIRPNESQRSPNTNHAKGQPQLGKSGKSHKSATKK